MITLKRRCVFAQAMFDLVDENGDWVGEISSPKMQVLSSQEKSLPLMVDKMLEKLAEEMIAKGQPVRMESGRWQVSGGAYGEGAGLQEGAAGLGIRCLPGEAGANKEQSEPECSASDDEASQGDGSGSSGRGPSEQFAEEPAGD